MILYTKNNCQACKFTKLHMQNMGVTYEERNVDENEAYMQEAIDTGYKSMPIVRSDCMYHIYRARKHVRLIYATGWRFIHNVGNNWYVGYTNELEDADLEKFDYEYLGYHDRNELERVIG